MVETGSDLVAVRYNRVSDDKRKLSRSVTEQEEEALDVTKAEGWIDGGSFSDPDMSASRFGKKERPEWAQLLDDVLPSGRVHVLILWETARGSRVLSTWAKLLEMCQQMKIFVHITSHEQTYDLNKPRHWKILAEDGVKAVYDSEETSLRVQRDMRKLAMTGLPTGKVPFGYERRYDPKTKEFLEQVIHEKNAKVVRDAAAWIASGKSVRSLIKHLQDQGIRTPSGKETWSQPQIRQMVLNPTYLGQRTHRKKIVTKAVWPRILDPKVQKDCQLVYSADGRSQERDGAIKHLLSGIAIGECGGRARVQPAHQYLAYECTKDKCFSIRKELLDDYVNDVAVARMGRRDFLNLIKDPGDDSDAAAAEAEVLRLTEKLEEVYEQASPRTPEDERLSPAGLARLERDYEQLIKDAERKARRLRVPAVLLTVAREDIAEVWPGLEMRQRRKVLRALMTITVSSARGRPNLPAEDRVKIEWA